MELLLEKIIKNPLLHAKWLNTLSYLENCGARKIAAYEHPTKVKEEMLKHAAEEFRHAHFFKLQISKVCDDPFPTYEPKSLLGNYSALHFLHSLDLQISRLVRKEPHFKIYCYLLVTYAIELRAKEIYTLYEKRLRQLSSKVFIKSVLIEEEEHLNEILEEMKSHQELDRYIQSTSSLGESLWSKLLSSLEAAILC